MDNRRRALSEQLAAGLIARREFLRKAAVVTGGTAAGLGVLRTMAGAQAKPKLRVWLFKSFVTAGNDVLAKHIESWAQERKVDVELDWATFGDREQKFVAAIEAGNPPDLAEMNLYGPMRYKPALRDVSKVATEIAKAKGGLLPFAEAATKADGKFFGVARYAMITVFYIRKDIMEAKGLKPPKLYDPDVVEFAKKTQDAAKDLWGFGQTLNRSDDGDGFMQNILMELRRRALGQGRQARARHVEPRRQPQGAPVRRGHHQDAQDPAPGRHGLDGRVEQRGLHGRQARHHQQRREPLLRHDRQEARAGVEDALDADAGRAGRKPRRPLLL